MDDVLSCGEGGSKEEWLTVARRKNKRGKGKAKVVTSGQPFTRSKARLMHRYPNGVRVPETTFLDL